MKKKSNMELSLKNRKWKEFSLTSMFSIERGKRLVIPKRIKGNIPLVTAGFQNEGVADFIQNEDQKTYNNSVTIDMFGNTFYREYIFKCDDNIHVLISDKLNNQIGNFISSAINQSTKNIFSYGKQFRLKTLEKLKILLPINSQGKPDYEFMEAYMRAKEQEKINAYKNYISKRIKKLENVKPVVPLKEKDWVEFEINKIFQIKSGKRLTKADMKKGKKPFIGATDNNNGITEYISNTNSSEDYNVLGVNYNGSVVENFYHPYKALFSDDVKRLSFKEVEGNKYLYLFAKTSILKQKSKYQYGYKFNGKRMNRQKIMFPINEKKEPDYEYMENYIKRLELEKIKKYLDYKETK